MRRTKAFRLLFACFLLLSLSVPSAPAQRKKQIAVLNFDFATVDIGLANRAYGGQRNLARRVADKLVTSLLGLGTCQVIERSQLERVLNEQNLGSSQRIDPSTAAKVGRILGVDALIIGNVSVFDLTGLPKDSRDVYWDAKDRRARIAVNFRVVDTTTAVIEASNELIGMSAGPPKQSTKGKIANDLLKGILAPKNPSVQVKDEQIRDVVQQAVDDVVGKITVDVEKYLSGARRQPEPVVAEKQINGRVIDINGPTVFIVNVNKSAVRIGDRLFVRRGRVKRDPVTGKEFRLSDKIGEVEIVEIQDEVIVGSFSGSMPVQIGDTVTNNPSGAGVTQAPLEPKRAQPASPTNTTFSQSVAPPSPRYRTVSGSKIFRIAVPENWSQFANNDSLTFAPQGAYGSHQGQSVFTHSAIVGVANIQSRDLQQATERYIKSLLQSNSYLQQRSNYRRSSIGQRNALTVTLAGRSPVTQRNEIVNVYTALLSKGQLFYVINVAPNEDYKSYEQVFLAMLRSIEFKG